MSRFFLFTILLIFGACDQNKQAEVSMDDEELVDMLEDLHIARSIVAKYRLFERDSISELLRVQIAKRHNMSVEGIDYVMEQIQMSPAKYLSLEKKAVESLKVMKDSLKLNQNIVTEK